MIEELAQILEKRVSVQINVLEHHLQYVFFDFLSALLIMLWSSCMEHIINLAVQAVIHVYSQSQFYEPQNPSAHVPDVNTMSRDIISLIRTAAVKVLHIFYTLFCFNFCLDTYILKMERFIYEGPKECWGEAKATCSRYACPLVIYLKYACVCN